MHHVISHATKSQTRSRKDLFMKTKGGCNGIFTRQLSFLSSNQQCHCNEEKAHCSETFRYSGNRTLAKFFFLNSDGLRTFLAGIQIN